MRPRSKRYRAAVEKKPERPQPIEQAVKTLKGYGKTKFDQTVDVVFKLGIDAKQADQAVRGSVSLPKGVGKTKKVIAFCMEGDIPAAKQAGAIEAGGDELIEKVNKGWMDFDVAISHPSLMGKVGRLGRVLGPQGKMPSPKSGTVTQDVPTAVREFAAGKVEFRNDPFGNIHAPVGKLSFPEADLKENIEAFLNHLRRVKPAAAKGQYIQRAFVSATMTPSVQLELEAHTEESE